MSSLIPNPSELEIFGTFFPPLMVAIILAGAGMVLTTQLLVRYRLLRYVFYPNVVLLAITGIYTVLIATFLIPA